MQKTLVMMASFAALALVVALTPTGQALADGMMNALLVSVVNDAAHPVPVHDVGSTGVAEYRFVGVSTNTVASNTGINSLYAACQADFGPSARTCTTVEFERSPEITGLSQLSTQAYIQPVVVGGFSFFDPVANADQVVLVDATGKVAKRQAGLLDLTLNCNEWLSSGSHLSGTVVRLSGQRLVVGLSLCSNSPSPVVCCAPRQGN